jgi:putative FmdB family regulatory protein
MPLYEYQCGNCGKFCEVLQKVNDAPAVTCPECGKDQLKRQLSAPSFQLKGSGWYATDYKKPQVNENGDSKSTSAETPKTETKTNSDKES